MSLSIRPCSPADAAMLALVGAATFLEAFADFLPAEAILGHCARNHSEAAYTRYLADGTSCAWLAESTPGDAPVGYALFTEPDFSPELIEPGDTELRRIYVFSRFRAGEVAEQGMERGTGQRLLDCAIAEAAKRNSPRLLLGVHRENERALRFYRRNLFKSIGVRTFQVGPKVFDDLVLARSVDQAVLAEN